MKSICHNSFLILSLVVPLLLLGPVLHLRTSLRRGCLRFSLHSHVYLLRLCRHVLAGLVPRLGHEGERILEDRRTLPGQLLGRSHVLWRWFLFIVG